MLLVDCLVMDVVKEDIVVVKIGYLLILDLSVSVSCIKNDVENEFFVYEILYLDSCLVGVIFSVLIY